MPYAPFRAALTLLLVVLVSLTAIGCANRAASAQKLFEDGKYQAVIDKYPDLEIARRARAKLAEDLLGKKDLQAVLSQYPDTPAAYKARMEMAQQLFDRGQFQMVVDSFPHSPLAVQAKERLADSLFASGQIDALLARFPETPKAKQIKEERATASLDKAKRLRGAAQKSALEELMAQYAGTEAYKEAGQMLSKLRSADIPKNR